MATTLPAAILYQSHLCINDMVASSLKTNNVTIHNTFGVEMKARSFMDIQCLNNLEHSLVSRRCQNHSTTTNICQATTGSTT